MNLFCLQKMSRLPIKVDRSHQSEYKDTAKDQDSAKNGKNCPHNIVKRVKVELKLQQVQD